MKKTSVSKVYELFGVSRKALRGYKDIGLLVPKEDESSGYWYYDEEAINKLMLIQIFTEVGYKRKDIKEMLESPQFDIMAEFDNVLYALEVKRTRISSMISQVKIMKAGAEAMAEAAYIDPKIVTSFDLSVIFNDESFKDSWKSDLAKLSKLTESEKQDLETSLPFIKMVYMIGLLKNKGAQEEATRSCVSTFNELCMQVVLDLSDDETRKEYGELSDKDKSILSAVVGISFAEEFLSDCETVSSLEKLTGQGVGAFIMEALMSYGENLSGEESFSEILNSFKEET